MEKKEITLYEFSELEGKARDRALVILAERQDNDPYWYANVFEDFKEVNSADYQDIDINFSGFGSQGDGASFTAVLENEYVLKCAKRCKIELTAHIEDLIHTEEITFSIERNDSRYSHERTISVLSDPEHFDDHLEDAQIEKLCDALTEDARTLSKMLYKQLRDEYEYLRSETVLADESTSYGIKFTSDGELFDTDLT